MSETRRQEVAIGAFVLAALIVIAVMILTFGGSSGIFSSSYEITIRFRHIAKRPAVSATYLPEEAVSVTTHGRAEMIDVATYDDGAYRQVLLEYYGGRFGGDASGFIDGGGLAYARIDATKMFTFYLDPATL
jgi:hypothetical protein